MRLVKNPLYKHSRETISVFDKLKASIFHKDHSRYNDAEIQTLIDIVASGKEYGLKSKHLLWLTKILIEEYDSRRKTDPDQIETWGIFAFLVFEDHPILSQDYFPILESYERNKQLLPDLFQFSTIDQLGKAIEDLSLRELIVSDKTLDIFFEFDGWFISMPHTTEASCYLGKQTSWCTARTKSQNLFLSYVARENENIILFYLIKMNGNPLVNPNDKISIGFVDCKIVFHYEMTVNASNQPLTKAKIISIFGEENYERIILEMTKKCKTVAGKHPAKKEMERLVLDRKLFRKKIDSFKSESDREEFLKQAAEYKTISSAVVTEVLVSSEAAKSEYMRLANITKFNKKEELEILDKINNIPRLYASEFLRNKNLSPEIMDLAIERKIDRPYFLAANESITKEAVKALIKYYKKEDLTYLFYLAKNEGLKENIAIELVKYTSDLDEHSKMIILGGLSETQIHNEKSLSIIIREMYKLEDENIMTGFINEIIQDSDMQDEVVHALLMSNRRDIIKKLIKNQKVGKKRLLEIIKKYNEPEVYVKLVSNIAESIYL